MRCGALAGSADAAETALVRSGIDPLARGESLTVLDFTRLAEALQEAAP